MTIESSRMCPAAPCQVRFESGSAKRTIQAMAVVRAGTTQSFSQSTRRTPRDLQVWGNPSQRSPPFLEAHAPQALEAMRPREQMSGSHGINRISVFMPTIDSKFGSRQALRTSADILLCMTGDQLPISMYSAAIGRKSFGTAVRDVSFPRELPQASAEAEQTLDRSVSPGIILFVPAPVDSLQ